MAAKIIIVTGGIGSGKSAVCRSLSRRGIPVYDCDSRAKALYEVYPDLKALVVPDIFKRPDALKALETALFPLLMKDFELWVQNHASDAFFVAFESATVLQKEFFDNFGDYVMLVDAPSDIRLERVVQRTLQKVVEEGRCADRDAVREDVKRRMELQMDNRNNPRVTFILENTGSLENMEQQIDRFLDKIN